MSDTPVTKIAVTVMTIGITPSNFDPKYNGQIKRCERSVFGLDEGNAGNQLCVVFKLPKAEGELVYGYCGMSIDELRKLNDGFKTKNAGGDEFELVWDEAYPEISKAVLKEAADELQAGEIC